MHDWDEVLLQQISVTAVCLLVSLSTGGVAHAHKHSNAHKSKCKRLSSVMVCCNMSWAGIDMDTYCQPGKHHP